jgi:hypothetical protein
VIYDYHYFYQLLHLFTENEDKTSENVVRVIKLIKDICVGIRSVNSVGDVNKITVTFWRKCVVKTASSRHCLWHFFDLFYITVIGNTAIFIIAVRNRIFIGLLQNCKHPKGLFIFLLFRSLFKVYVNVSVVIILEILDWYFFTYL